MFWHIKVVHACTCALAVQCCFVELVHCTMFVGKSRHGKAVQEPGVVRCYGQIKAQQSDLRTGFGSWLSVRLGMAERSRNRVWLMGRVHGPKLTWRVFSSHCRHARKNSQGHNTSNPHRAWAYACVLKVQCCLVELPHCTMFVGTLRQGRAVQKNMCRCQATLTAFSRTWGFVACFGTDGIMQADRQRQRVLRQV